MSTIVTHHFVRLVALPVVSADIIGGAVLGLAGPADAAAIDPQAQPVVAAAPQIKAQPATQAMPGSWWHRHHPSLVDPTVAGHFIQPGS